MYKFTPPVGEQSVTVAAFEPELVEPYGLTGWSLKPIQRQEDVERHGHLASRLSSELSFLDVKEAFAPNVAAFSGHIATSGDMTTKIVLDHAILRRNRELPADGVFLDPKQGFVMSAAGCPIILAGGGNYFIAAHAGRDSLIERNAVTGKGSRREHQSVVDAIADKFWQRGVPKRDIAMVMMFSIPAEAFEHRFDHPTYGEYNRLLDDFVRTRWPDCMTNGDNSMFLSLERVFAEQAVQHGISKVSACYSLAEFPRLAHTRDGGARDRRNLIVVRRDT